MAIVFDETADLGSFRERIAPSAIARTLREKLDVVALFDHDAGRPLGRLSAKTLRLMPTTRGLEFEVDPPSHESGVVESVERRDIDGASFGFVTLEDKWTIDQGKPLRTVTDARVPEISIVTWPQYLTTSVSTRSLEGAMSETIIRGTALERRPARETRDTERARAVRDEFARAWMAAGQPADFAMRYTYDDGAPPAKPTTLDERLKLMEGRRRLWEMEGHQRAVGRLLEAEERVRLRKLARGPAPKSVADRLEWLKAKAAQW